MYQRTTNASSRYVPVKLIAGKEYVLRNGRHVTVQENPHWQCAAKFPFFVMQGPDYIRYFTATGEADPDGGENADDIVRPVYKGGEVYLDRNGVRRVIDLDDNSTTYPLEDEGSYASWTRGGRASHSVSSARDCDLMDYEHARPLPILATPVTPSRVGMRVEAQLASGVWVQATIMYEHASCFAVEFDPDYDHPGAWECDGHVPSGRGWYVTKDWVRAVSDDKAEAKVEAERGDAEALNEVDVAEVWAAYRVNPSISIDAWVAARRQLKATAK